MRTESIARSSRKLTIDWFREITVPGAGFAGPSSVRPIDHPGYVRKTVPQETFCTGSSYRGQVDSLGFAGFGTYSYPGGAKYQGYFRDGQFHGNGTITYPNGDYVEGVWIDGKVKTSTFHFANGLKFEQPWRYCQFPDRRFQDEESKPQIDNEMPRHNVLRIPQNCYYTGDGYYEPDLGLVYSKNQRVLRIVSKKEEREIKENYREENDRHAEFSHEFYEFWTAGRAKEINRISEIENEKIKKEMGDTPYCPPTTIESISLYSLSFITK